MSRVSQARSPGKYFLLVDNMLVVLGFFCRIPTDIDPFCRPNGLGGADGRYCPSVYVSWCNKD